MMRTTEPKSPAPLLVLGLGNRLLRDDAVGLELLELLRGDFAGDPRVELVDGGTQGLGLIGWLEGRRVVVLLDAVNLGLRPGAVYLSTCPTTLCTTRGTTAHEGNASELLLAAMLLGTEPGSTVLVGVEAAEIRTDVGLSEPVREGLGRAHTLARDLLRRMLEEPAAPELAACTS